MTVPSLHGDTRAFVSANRRLGRCVTVLAFAAGLACAGALGADLYHAGEFDVRWDNTLQYSAAFRLFPRDDFLVSYSANNDDGDRNFSPGLISNRLDALSELELTDGDFGLRLSAAAWYDSVYDQRNDNDSARTFNPFSVPHNEFTRAVRVLHGGDVQLMDAFVHGSFDVADIPVSFRIGRYTLLWGESVFFGANGIAGGQAPTDDIKEFEQPSAYSRNIFLPVWQASAVVQPTENIAVSLYYQFQWRKDQFPGSGSYFSYFDYLDQGGERYILPYFIGLYQYFYRIRDVRAPSSGQFGVALLLNSPAFNYGFYALRFNAKDPQIYLTGAVREPINSSIPRASSYMAQASAPISEIPISPENFPAGAICPWSARRFSCRREWRRTRASTCFTPSATPCTRKSRPRTHSRPLRCGIGPI